MQTHKKILSVILCAAMLLWAFSIGSGGGCVRQQG
jgi:hypothetical protein